MVQNQLRYDTEKILFTSAVEDLMDTKDPDKSGVDALLDAMWHRRPRILGDLLMETDSSINDHFLRLGKAIELAAALAIDRSE